MEAFAQQWDEISSAKFMTIYETPYLICTCGVHGSLKKEDYMLAFVKSFKCQYVVLFYSWFFMFNFIKFSL